MGSAKKNTLSVSRVRVEQVPEGEIVGSSQPRLSWVVEASEPDVEILRHELRFETDAAAGDGRGEKREVVDGAGTVLQPWPFDPLQSRQEGQVSVRSSDSEGQWSPWSEPCRVVAGLLHASDWSASFVTPRTLAGLDDGAPFVFTTFELDELPVRARLYASAHGVYLANLNGRQVGDDVLAPGWTEYAHRVRYQSYDVTGALVIGRNTLGALLGNGWFRGQLVWPGHRSSYGENIALLAQLELEFGDGTRTVMGTDRTWSARATRILADDLYDGETQDCRIPLLGEDDAPEQEGVRVLEPDAAALVTRRGPPVRITGRLSPLSSSASPSGRTLIDFGQNLVGWVELHVRGGEPGAEVTVRHAEVLEDGELSLRPLRSAKVTCRYLLSGVGGSETLRPNFTFNGFRFCDIVMPAGVELVSATAIVIGSDLERIGWFESSHDGLNRLHKNIVWGARGNFLDLPTDCPQRDERLGWTGDIQVFVPTGNFLFDTSGFLAGWLEDLAVAQKPDGGVPFIVPDVLREADPAATGWGDAAVVVPWNLYLSYGDKAVLERQYPSMVAWVEKMVSLADGDSVWNASGQFGDWLDPTAPPDEPGQAKADQAVVATAHFARSARMLAQSASVIGKSRDADHFMDLADRVAAGFLARFVSDDGTILSDCQTVYALALAWDLISDETARLGAGRRLVDLVEKAHYRVSTGFLGTPVILDALCAAGRPDVAYRMLLNTEVPSWLYAVTMGATTVWERWDSMLPDGSVNPGTMTSFNHYAYGAVADWMHRALGGLEPIEPAYRRFRVRPLVADGLDHASVVHVSPYGRIEVGWRREGQGIRVDVAVPFGCHAEVWMPGDASPLLVGAGHHSFTGRVPEWYPASGAHGD
ncbi:MAG: family 78 glycoside hydrolase catalytic domain [Salinibacterium sp.]|nr:family 78 glycoside hydrolase catalytic domain [Salinibacterium sp.]